MSRDLLRRLRAVPDGPTKEMLDEWPNCAVPDCEHKAVMWGGSPFCYPHTFGALPPSEEGPTP